MAFGVTSTGFTRKNLEDILKALADRQHASPALGPSLDTDDETALGQLNGTFASELAEAWELLEECFHGMDPEDAEDFALTVLSSLTGTLRRAATKSTSALTVNLNAGTTLPAGSTVAVLNRPDITFTTDVALGPVVSTGNYTAQSTCTQTGPIAALAGTLTVIVTPVSGWNTVTNPADAITGRAVDNDVTLRQRREDELALRGGSTLKGIKSDVLKVTGVNTASVLENTGEATDANGLPPHSFEVVIDDGDVPAASNNSIAQAIWDSKPAGIQPFGTLSGTALDDLNVSHTVNFSRVTLKPVFIDVFITTTSDYDAINGPTNIKTAVAAEGNKLKIDADVIALNLRAKALTVVGVVDVPTFELGFFANPSGTANLTVGPRERATFNTANITVT